jgi:hypothetical protein
MARLPAPAGDFCSRPFRFTAAQVPAFAPTPADGLQRSSSAHGP